MGFVSYRATRQIDLGQIRRTLQPGDVLDFDGRTLRLSGKTYVVPTIGTIIKEGWLVPTDPSPDEVLTLTTTQTYLPTRIDPTTQTKTPRKPQEPNHAGPPREDQALNLRGDPILYASSEARAASGKRPAPNQQHVWGGGPNSPDWLNGSDGQVCRVCGVTKLAEGSLVRADRMRGDGSQQFHYRDAHGNMITSFEELSCPTYLGDPGSAAAVAKDQVRKVRGRVDDVEDKLETVDDRLARLESDRDFFRNRLLEQPILDAKMVAEALLLIASGRVGDKGPTILAERVRALLPESVRVDILQPVLEAELVEVTSEAEGDPQE